MSSPERVVDRDSVVTVFGSGDPQPGEPQWLAAEAVGRCLAENGCAVATGGYGGVMEACSRGAKDAGGQTIGVPCSIWSSSPRAEILDEIVPTTSYTQRVETLVNLGARGWVALPGGTGTLVEVAWVWEMVGKRMTPARPIVLVGHFWQPLVEMMASIRPGSDRAVHVVEDPEILREIFSSRAG